MFLAQIEARSVCTDTENHSVINIVGDTELAGMASSGEGTVFSPYIIGGLIIDEANKTGINITQTSKHFIIQNCTIIVSGERGKYFGILIQGVTTNTAQIHNNTVKGAYFGIKIINSPGTIVSDNYCYDNYHDHIKLEKSSHSIIRNNTCTTTPTATDVYSKGIGIWDSHSLTIIDNNCFDNYDGGIYLLDSTDIEIANNLCRDGNDGIYLHHSSSLRVLNNTCASNHVGIYLLKANDVLIQYNLIKENDYGIRVQQSEQAVIVNNTFQGNYIYLDLIDATSITVNTGTQTIIDTSVPPETNETSTEDPDETYEMTPFPPAVEVIGILIIAIVGIKRRKGWNY